jgi:tetratricopeptide (TPR) repeat protein
MLAFAAAAPAFPQTAMPAPTAPAACAGPDIDDASLPGDGPASSGPREKADFAARYYSRAQEYRKCGEAALAGKNFDIAVGLDAANYTIRAERGAFRFSQGDLNGAIADWSEVISHEDNVPANFNMRFVYGNRARAYMQLGQYGEARDDLTAAIEKISNPQIDDKTKLVYRERRGEAYLHLGQYEPAADDFGFAVSLDVNSAKWKDDYWLGFARLNLGKPDLAIDALAKAEAGRREDSSPDAAALEVPIELAFGQAYVARKIDGDISRARTAFTAVLSKEPENTAASEALRTLPTPPPAPSFTGREPVFKEVVMPRGVSDLEHDALPVFCAAEDKNQYFDQIAVANQAVNDNIEAIRRYVGNDATDTGSLEQELQQYRDSQLLTRTERDEDAKLISQEIDRYNAMSRSYYVLGQRLLAFDRRVRGDATPLARCKDGVPVTTG